MHTQRIRAFGTDDAPRVGALAGAARATIGPLIRLTFDIETLGAHRLPRSGPAILCANHLSFFDTPVLMFTAPRPVTFLGKAEYMDSATTKFLFPAMGMVPIKRQDRRASAAALGTAADLLADDHWVGIYPEGTRTRDGMLHRGKSGVAQLALMTGAPIIPVGLRGTNRAQPIGARLPVPFRGPIRVEYGEPIDPANYRYGGGRKRRQHILADVMGQIATMSSQPTAPDFEVHDNPLMWGGTEVVYKVTRHGATGLSWRQAAERAVDHSVNRYDGRVAEVARLRCRLGANGQVLFDAEIDVSSRLHSAPSPEPANTAVADQPHQPEGSFA